MISDMEKDNWWGEGVDMWGFFEAGEGCHLKWSLVWAGPARVGWASLYAHICIPVIVSGIILEWLNRPGNSSVEYHTAVKKIQYEAKQQAVEPYLDWHYLIVKSLCKMK